MDRWSVSELSSVRWSFERDVSEYLACGFRNIGVWNRKLSDYTMEQCEDCLFDHQLGVSSYSWLGGFTGSEGISFKDAVVQAIDDIRFAARIGAETLIVYPGSKNGHTNKHARRLLQLGLEQLIPWAQDYGVRLALEPMHPDHNEPWNVLADFEATAELVRQFDSRSLGLVLDLYHVGGDQRVFNSMDELAERIVLVQLADWISQRRPASPADQLRRPLGTGNLQLCEWIVRLEQLGYEGYYELELHGRDVEWLGYRDRLVHTRNAITRLTQRIQQQSPSFQISNLKS